MKLTVGQVVGIKPFSPLSEEVIQSDGLARVLIIEVDVDNKYYDRYYGVYYDHIEDKGVNFVGSSVVKIYDNPKLPTKLKSDYIQKVIKLKSDF